MGGAMCGGIVRLMSIHCDGFIGGRQPQNEDSTPRRRILDVYLAAMGFRHFGDDGKAETGPSASAIGAPEPLEYQRAIFGRNAGPRVDHPNGAVRIDLDLHGGPLGRMRERIFDQIADRLAERFRIAAGPNRSLDAANRDPFAIFERKWCEGRRRIDRDLMKIDRFERAQAKRVELGDAEQLTDEAAHDRKLLAQSDESLAIAKRVEMRAQNGKRRPQFVRRVGGELALHLEAAIESLERSIDAPDQGDEFAGLALLGKAATYRFRTDLGRHARHAGERPQSGPNAHQIDDQEETHERNRQPSDLKEKLAHEIVEEDAALVEVLEDLHEDSHAVYLGYERGTVPVVVKVGWPEREEIHRPFDMIAAAIELNVLGHAGIRRQAGRQVRGFK